MVVSIEPMSGVNVATGEEVSLHRMRIRVDGKHAGTIKLDAGCKAALYGKWSDAESDQIATEVARLMQSKEVPGVARAPNVPEELRQRITNLTEEMAVDDDFDESGDL